MHHDLEHLISSTHSTSQPALCMQVLGMERSVVIRDQFQLAEVNSLNPAACSAHSFVCTAISQSAAFSRIVCMAVVLFTLQ